MKKITAMVLVFIFVITIFSGCGQKAPTVEALLSLGNKYLTELDYEKAIVTFNKVIEIEPKNARGYIGAAEAYIGLGDLEKAISILEEGFEATDNEEISSMRASLLSKNKIGVNSEAGEIIVLSVEERNQLEEIAVAIKNFDYKSLYNLQSNETILNLAIRLPYDKNFFRAATFKAKTGNVIIVFD